VSGIPVPQYGVAASTRPGPNGNEANRDNYFQYINVPQLKTYEWGYHRGNGIGNFYEEFLSQKNHAFKAKVINSYSHFPRKNFENFHYYFKVKWEKANEGLGEIFYDYNHVQKVEEPQRGSYSSEPVLSYGPSNNIF